MGYLNKLNEMQNGAVGSWYNTYDYDTEHIRGTVIAPTGVGKTFIALKDHFEIFLKEKNVEKNIFELQKEKNNICFIYNEWGAN